MSQNKEHWLQKWKTADAARPLTQQKCIRAVYGKRVDEQSPSVWSPALICLEDLTWRQKWKPICEAHETFHFVSRVHYHPTSLRRGKSSSLVMEWFSCVGFLWSSFVFVFGEMPCFVLRLITQSQLSALVCSWLIETECCIWSESTDKSLCIWKNEYYDASIDTVSVFWYHSNRKRFLFFLFFLVHTLEHKDIMSLWMSLQSYIPKSLGYEGKQKMGFWPRSKSNK